MQVPGHCFGGLRLEEQVGANSVSTLWRATDLQRGGICGIRVLAPEADAYRAEFVAAAGAQRTLTHPNRIRVLDVVDLDGVPAIVTEHLAGPSLATWMRIRARSADAIMTVFQDIVAGVSSAHELDLWHLHFDPSQICMHTRRGTFVPKVDLAFGPMALAGMRLGRIRAPEHAGGLQVDGRADVFLLGALLYELLGGRIADDPTASRCPTAEIGAFLPKPAAALVDRMMADAAGDRPDSVEHLTKLLVLAAETVEIAASTCPAPVRSVAPLPAGPRPAMDEPQWHHPVAVASMVAVAALSLVGALFVLGG